MDIGKEVKEIEFEPIESPAEQPPVEAPPVPVETPAEQPVGV